MPDVVSQSEAVPLLSGFAPLIQLWAGICLLCFYEAFMNRSPFRPLSKKIKCLYLELLGLYKGYLHDLTEEDAKKYSDDNWPQTKNAIKSISIVFFTGSVLLLGFTGIESTGYCQRYVPSVIFLDIFLLAYGIFGCIFYRWLVFQKIIITIFISLFLAIYLICFNFHVNKFFIENGISWISLPYSTIIFATIICSISGLFFVGIKLWFRHIKLIIKRRIVSSLSRDFEQLTNILMCNESNIDNEFKNLSFNLKFLLLIRFCKHWSDFIKRKNKNLVEICINEIIKFKYENFRYGSFKMFFKRLWSIIKNLFNLKINFKNQDKNNNKSNEIKKEKEPTQAKEEDKPINQDLLSPNSPSLTLFEMRLLLNKFDKDPHLLFEHELNILIKSGYIKKIRSLNGNFIFRRTTKPRP